MNTTAISLQYSAGSAQAFGCGLKPLIAPEATPIVFVLDEDPSVRESLELLIRGEGWRCETFASAQEFFGWPPTSSSNCLILDVLSCSDAVDLQKRIAIDRAGTAVIFIAGRIDIATTVKVMKAGAVEFLTKPVPEDALLNAIRGDSNAAVLVSLTKCRCEHSATVTVLCLAANERSWHWWFLVC